MHFVPFIFQKFILIIFITHALSYFIKFAHFLSQCHLLSSMFAVEGEHLLYPQDPQAEYAQEFLDHSLEYFICGASQ